MAGSPKTAVLVPMKSFGSAKSRLAEAMSPAQRESLVRWMARNVLHAASGLRVAIVASATATDVRRFALINGARFFAEPQDGGVDGAVRHGVNQLANLGYERVVVVHSDLPLVQDLNWLAEAEGITIVSDRSGRGTNAVSLPADAAFRFSYGPGSLERHCDEARRLGYEPNVVVDLDGISSDVDDPDDVTKTNAFEVLQSLTTREVPVVRAEA